MKIDEISYDSPEPIYYFAYGMLTDPRHMPGGIPIGSAVLKNHRFEFFHYANVIDSPNEEVHGALWQVSRELLANLDSVEGVPYLYGRKQLPVFSSGKRYEAWIYQMTPNSRKTAISRTPSSSYIATLKHGYSIFGLPTSQINQAYKEAKDDDDTWMKYYGMSTDK